MTIFSSLRAALRAGFQWHSYSSSHQLHLVELDRMGHNGHREKAIAFARPSEDDTDLLQSAA